MKNITITAKQQKTEIKYIIISFFLAVALNLYAIISYGTDFKELYTQWFTVLLLTLFFYLGIALFRILFRLIFKPKNNIRPQT